MAEGFDILKHANSPKLAAELRLDLDVADIAEVWRRGSVITSWLLDLTATALAEDGELAGYSGHVEDSGEGRWTVQAAIEEAVPAEVLTSRALHALPLAPGPYLRREGAVGHAQGLRRPCRAGEPKQLDGRLANKISRHGPAAHQASARVIVLMGVSGSGKSTTGKRSARRSAGSSATPTAFIRRPISTR